MMVRSMLPAVMAVNLLCAAQAYAPPAEFAFAGLFPVKGFDVGATCSAAAMLAMKEINARADLLPNTTLVQDWGFVLGGDTSDPSLIGQYAGQPVTDDHCDPKMGVNVLMQQVMRNPNIGGILGAACSSVCQATSQIATGLRIPQISFSCTSPSLSDSSTYPWFTRLVGSDGLNTDLFIEFLQLKNVTKVGLLGDTSGFCSGIMDYFQTHFTAAGGAIQGVREKWDQGTLKQEEATNMLKRLAQSGAKVLYSCNYAEDDLPLKAAAYELGLNSDPSNLMFAIWPQPWLAVDDAPDAKKDELRQTHAGWSSFFFTEVGETAAKVKYLSDLAKMNVTHISWCDYNYDAVYHFAYAIQNCIDKQVPASGKYLREALLRTSFDGITGPIKLQSNGDRKLSISLKQQNADGSKATFYEFDLEAGRSTVAVNAPIPVDTPVCPRVGGKQCAGNGNCVQRFTDGSFKQRCLCNSGFAGELCDSPCHAKNGKSNEEGVCICISRRWSGYDCSIELAEEKNLIPVTMKTIAFLMFAINLLTVLVCAFWVFRHGQTPQVKASQPFLLYSILGGCLVSSSTILALSAENSNTACAIFPWLYSIGFCITFSSLFVKIGDDSTNVQSRQAQSKTRTSGAKWAVIPGLIALDCILLGIWTAKDPLQWKRTALQVDVFSHTLVSAGQCEADSSGTYLAVIGTLHAVVLAYACYVCYNTKTDKTETSEGKYVALAMVSNLQVFVLGVPVLVVVGNDPGTSFFVRSAIVWLNDLAVVGFIFGNLMHSFYASQKLIDEVDACSDNPTVFLCHHKAGGGGVARLLKLSLTERGVRNIFLDSDNLVDLGSVVPVVAKSKHLMVTVTKELIFRPWCLCEIHTALSRVIPMTMLKVKGTEFPTKKQYREYVDYLFKQNRFRKIFDQNNITQETLLFVYDSIINASWVDLDVSSDRWSDTMDKLTTSVLGKVPFPRAKMASDDVGNTTLLSIFSSESATVAQIIKVMLQNFRPDINMEIDNDHQEKAERIAYNTTSMDRCYGVMVLLSKGLLECAPAMVKLVSAVNSGKRIIPINIDPSNPENSFVFPDDSWYLQKLPVLYQAGADIYKAHGIPLDSLATAIQELVMKLAVRFTENESGHAQRASIISIAQRYLSGTSESKMDAEHETAGIQVSHRHETAGVTISKRRDYENNTGSGQPAANKVRPANSPVLPGQCN